MHSSDEDLDLSESTGSSELWLDDSCLEPLASKPGYSVVCNACLKVFGVSPGSNIKANHIQCLDTLVRSAQRGCALCALLLYKIEGNDSSQLRSALLDIRYAVDIHTMMPPGVNFWSNGVLVVVLGIFYSGNYPDSFSMKQKVTCIRSEVSSQFSSNQHNIEPKTSSLANQLLARKWLHQCLSSRRLHRKRS